MKNFLITYQVENSKTMTPEEYLDQAWNNLTAFARKRPKMKIRAQVERGEKAEKLHIQAAISLPTNVSVTKDQLMKHLAPERESDVHIKTNPSRKVEETQRFIEHTMHYCAKPVNGCACNTCSKTTYIPTMVYQQNVIIKPLKKADFKIPQEPDETLSFNPLSEEFKIPQDVDFKILQESKRKVESDNSSKKRRPDVLIVPGETPGHSYLYKFSRIIYTIPDELEKK